MEIRATETNRTNIHSVDREDKTSESWAQKTHIHRDPQVVEAIQHLGSERGTRSLHSLRIGRGGEEEGDELKRSKFKSSKVRKKNNNTVEGVGWSIVKPLSMSTSTAKVAPATNVLDVAPVANGKRERDEATSLVLSSRKDSEKEDESTNNINNNAHKSTATRIACHPIMGKAYAVMEGRVWMTSITLATVYALFGDDLRTAIFSQSIDTAFYTISLLCMLAFAVELFVFTMVKKGYYKSFYFWLDVLATVTMFTDVGFLWTPLLNLMLTGNDSTNQSSQDALAAIRASRVGTKSSRIVRIVRLVRLVRVVKLYKVSKGGDIDDNLAAEENPSLVGKKLSDKTMQRVITVVLSMLIFVQFFDYSMYVSKSPQGMYGIYRLHKRLSLFNQSDRSAFENFLDTEFKDEVQDYTLGIEDRRLLYLNFYGVDDVDQVKILQFAQDTSWYDEDGNELRKNEDLDYTPSNDIKLSQAAINSEYRNTEYEVAAAEVCFDESTKLAKFPLDTSCGSYAFFDVKNEVRWAAGLNVLQTIFVMIVLTGGSLMFSNDAEKLVIRPIERMVISVKRLAENPMGSQDIGNLASNGDPNDDDETVLLQRTIAKIGQLLQIGFGEAGSEIIAMNMSTNSGIEPMSDGVKIEAIFGFCDIRNFTDTTECLQEKVMVYVNKVGAIVHEATHSWYGAANKNIGDAFLLVWKVKDSKGNFRHKDPIASANMCDNALVAFIRSLIDLKRENGPGGCLHEYKDNPAIRKRFGEGNFEIRLGMGLHIGWAIEGTIGSKYKIDASYLSPNVNMAARLEAATKQFRTPLLLSEDFYDGLSSKARKRCRQIDRVTVKGSIQPMGLFTCDIINYTRTFGEKEFFEDGSRKSFDFDSVDMDEIQRGLPDKFFTSFGDVMNAYFAGEWKEAKRLLEAFLKTKPDDGPAVSLLLVMESSNFNAPEGWKGFRELTEK